MGNAHVFFSIFHLFDLLKNLPTNNLVVFLQLEDYKRTTQFIDSKLSEDKEFINKPINKMNDTILHYAAYKGNRALVEYLLDKGANVNATNTRKLTPIDVCEKDKEIRDLLIQRKNKT